MVWGTKTRKRGSVAGEDKRGKVIVGRGEGKERRIRDRPLGHRENIGYTPTVAGRRGGGTKNLCAREGI